MIARSLGDGPTPRAARATVTIVVDGTPTEVPTGSTVAAALLGSGTTAFRHSVTGTPRAAVCGMGVCFECRVAIDGAPHQRSCLVTVREGMTINTSAPEEPS